MKTYEIKCYVCGNTTVAETSFPDALGDHAVATSRSMLVCKDCSPAFKTLRANNQPVTMAPLPHYVLKT